MATRVSPQNGEHDCHGFFTNARRNSPLLNSDGLCPHPRRSWHETASHPGASALRRSNSRRRHAAGERMWSPFQRRNAGVVWVEQPGDDGGLMLRKMTRFGFRLAAIMELATTRPLRRFSFGSRKFRNSAFVVTLSRDSVRA